MRGYNRQHSQFGFTLVELIVSIVVIAGIINYILPTLPLPIGKIVKTGFMRNKRNFQLHLEWTNA